MYLYIIFYLIPAYLLGSIPSAVWFGKWFTGIDVREHGSGNAGATNTIRVLGYKTGIPVLLFDVLKGFLAVKLVGWLHLPGISETSLVYVEIGAAMAAVTGHVFPLFAGFRGGKGVGTLAGVGIALYPLALLIVLGVFIVVLVFFRYVSLASVTAALLFPLVVVFVTDETRPAMVLLAVAVALFIPVTHRKNLRRLFKGEENKFDFKRTKEKQKGPSPK
ncbi:MAG TPA: glycerol-3-phosphate 1-O-acyltransferase PlsY [Bacteroidales bacterium]|nr:glycerol-3-phosphate 1-O-acyltransferase PlsY [Bacteroidales bacterium]HPT10367.1 glycerol-3-phosphate 1-O-acyltransferase PlsY [Bacteroidales bacterium]